MRPSTYWLVLATSLILAPFSAAQDYDIVILNGRVMDPETRFDGIRNVGITGDRIVKITAEAITGTKTIDASGHVVAPGFINTHCHSFGGFAQKMMAHDGTTTILDTESGVADAARFYKKYEGKSFLNFGTGMSHEEIRRVVMDRVDIDVDATLKTKDYSTQEMTRSAENFYVSLGMPRLPDLPPRQAAPHSLG